MRTLERIQAVDTVPLLLAMLDDANSDVQVRAAYAKFVGCPATSDGLHSQTAGCRSTIGDRVTAVNVADARGCCGVRCW